MLYIISLKDKEGRTTTALIDAEKERDAREIARKTVNHIARKGKSKVLNSKGSYIIGTAVSLELSGLVREGNKTYGVCLTTRNSIKDIKIDNVKSIMDVIEETIINTEKIKVEKRIFIRALEENKLKRGEKEDYRIIDEKELFTIEELKDKYKLKDMIKLYPLSELSGYYTFKELLTAYTIEELEEEYNIEAELRKLSEEVKLKTFINLTNIKEIRDIERYYPEKEIAGVKDKEEVIGYYQSLATLSELYRIEELSSHYSLEELKDYYNLQEIGLNVLLKHFDISAIIEALGEEMSDDDRWKLAGYVKKNKLEYQLIRSELEVLGIEV